MITDFKGDGGDHPLVSLGGVQVRGAEGITNAGEQQRGVQAGVACSECDLTSLYPGRRPQDYEMMSDLSETTLS